MTEKKSDNGKLIFVISEQGNCGKSTISVGIADQLRKNGKQCAVYLLDNMDGAKSTYDRLKQTDEFGREVLEQDPEFGVKIIDVLNQGGGNPENNNEETEEVAVKVEAKESNKEAVNEFLNTLRKKYEYTLYDFPGQSFSFFKNLFKEVEGVNGEESESELETTLKLTKKDIYIVIPIMEEKSMASLSALTNIFKFKNQKLQDRIHIVAIYNEVKEDTKFKYETFLEHSITKSVEAARGANFQKFRLLHLANNYLPVMKGHPYSFYYDEEEDEPINLENVTDEEVTFLLFIRRLLKQGFIPITRKLFLEK